MDDLVERLRAAAADAAAEEYGVSGLLAEAAAALEAAREDAGRVDSLLEETLPLIWQGSYPHLHKRIQAEIDTAREARNG